ncbi:hypothetical protein H9L39_18725 [Fusarium oxysporum f. sp. albedinis]|jgi:hypothetical protein|nr:hypothetical protein H9L39_18725 [Fusarium oxysporum f. sp. albedinis]
MASWMLYLRCKSKATDWSIHKLTKTEQNCGEVVADHFYPSEEKGGVQQTSLCETDYFRRMDLICYQCDKALRDSYIDALGHKYHVGHFKCSDCETTFGKEYSYYEHDDKPYCAMHYCRSYAGRCDACQLPILGKFIEVTDKRIDKKWHPECHVIARDLEISLPL